MHRNHFVTNGIDRGRFRLYQNMAQAVVPQRATMRRGQGNRTTWNNCGSVLVWTNILNSDKLLVSLRPESSTSGPPRGPASPLESWGSDQPCSKSSPYLHSFERPSQLSDNCLGDPQRIKTHQPVNISSIRQMDVQ
jgi:hypothetical protein